VEKVGWNGKDRVGMERIGILTDIWNWTSGPKAGSRALPAEKRVIYCFITAAPGERKLLRGLHRDAR
jgi:hypothetical protein